MRVLTVMLVGVAGLAAQTLEHDASARLQQDVQAKAEKFAQSLHNAMRPSGGKVSIALARPPQQICAIPLLRVGPDSSFKSNMPAIAPGLKVTFAARELVPPAPMCEEQARK